MSAEYLPHDPDLKPAVGAPVERPVRPLVERLRDAAQGVDLGADGMGWSPDPSLMREAADEIERLTQAVKAARYRTMVEGRISYKGYSVKPPNAMLRSAVPRE